MRLVSLVGLVLVLLLRTIGVSAQEAATQEAPPQDAVEGILAAFQNHPIVGIGEFHGVEQYMPLYERLLRHPRFIAEVGNIVFETGNSFYQDVMDRYIAGEAISDQELLQALSPTIAYGPTPLPQTIFQFLALVREINQTLPEGERLRLLLADPPLDPANPPSMAGGPPPNRDEHMAQIIEQVLVNGEKALFIVGSTHLMPQGFPFALPGEAGGPMIITQPSEGGATVVAPSDVQVPLPLDLGRNVRQIIEERHPGAIYAVQLHMGLAQTLCNAELEARLSSGATPVLVAMRGTWLEELLSRPECASLEANGMPRYVSTWGDAYLMLAPADALTIAPTSPDGASIPLFDAFRDLQALMPVSAP
jgi:hypothetical protein